MQPGECGASVCVCGIGNRSRQWMMGREECLLGWIDRLACGLKPNKMKVYRL